MTVLDCTMLRGQLRGTLELMRVLQRFGEQGDPSQANQLLGATTTTLLQWRQQRHRGIPECNLGMAAQPSEAGQAADLHVLVPWQDSNLQPTDEK
jgi:hypothetical protein